jgi:hypothetical protein
VSIEASPNTNVPKYEVVEPVFGLAYSRARFSEVPLHLLYGSESPASVTLRFFPGADEPVDWEFSRRTLARGFFEPHGTGDVRVEPWEDNTILVHLNPRNAPKTRVVLPRTAVQTFLDKAYQTVPARDEDGMIASALDAWIQENIPVIPTHETAGAPDVEQLSV